MLPSNVTRRIVEETNIVEVVGEYVKLQKKGNSHFGLCPFHDDKNPSMSVSNKVKLYNCFSCGAKGNVISFVSKFENINEEQACIKLANRIGLKLDFKVNKEAIKKERLYNAMKEASNFYQFYLRNSEEGLKALEYLHKRGINDAMIELFRIGLSPNMENGLNQYLNNKNISELDQNELGLTRPNENGKVHDIFRDRIMFPLCAPSGEVVGFSGRIYKDANVAKYINSNDNIIFHKGEVLYNFNVAANVARRKDRIYLFEGFMDVIAAYRARIDNGVATMGTALTHHHIKTLLSVTKNIVLCFDGDDAGIHAMKRSAQLLAEYNIIPDAIVLPNGLDPDEYIKANGAEMLNSYLISKAKPVYNYLYDLAYQKLSKFDLVSVETFKKEVFECLGFSRSQTIVEHFLKKMSNDLEVDLHKLFNDFDTSLKKYYNNNQQADNLDNQQVEQIPQQQNVQPARLKVKEVALPKSVVNAYLFVIKHLIYNPKRMPYFIDALGFGLVDHRLQLEATIITNIKRIIDEHPEFLLSKYPHERILPLLNDVRFKEYLDKVEENKFVNPKNDLEFKECLQTITSFIKRRKTIRHKNRALEGDPEAIKAFVNSKNVEIKNK